MAALRSSPIGIALTRYEVERCTARRGDADWLARAWADPRTRVLVVDGGQALARISDAAAELLYVSPEQAPDGVRFLLGVDAADVAYFGVGAQLAASSAVAGGSGPSGSGVSPGGAVSPQVGTAGSGTADGAVRRAGLREAGALLSDRDAGLLTHAVALANWHAVAGFCPRCGSPTEPILAGHARRCESEGSEHFPRLDPAVIMLVTDAEDRCLLARNVGWPARRFSVLAGFVEPGESAEQAVAREVREEVDVVVNSVRYAGSQPWPLPHNLMLAFRAEAAGTSITMDPDEIAEAGWYGRDDLARAIAASEMLMPPSLAVSRWLIETWYGEPLPRPPRSA